MPICQFFLRGLCKFGNSCRNDHRQAGGSFVGQSRFGQGNDKYHYNAKSKTTLQPSSLFGGRTPTGATNDPSAIIQLVRTELQGWDQNKVWPLSCFAAQKEHQCMPDNKRPAYSLCLKLTGFSDTSPEELRIEAYKHKEVGNLQPYLDGISSLTSQHLARRNQLKSMANQQLLEEINAANSGQSQSGNLFSTSPSTNNLFGTSAKPQHQSSGLFGQNQSINLVAPNQSSGLFSTQKSSTSLFGSGGSSPSATSGLFGSKTSSQNPFVSQGNNAVFGSQSNKTSGGLFSSGSQPASQGLFSTPGNLFSNSSTSNTSGGLFSSSQQQLNASTANLQQNPTNLFSSTTKSLPTPFGSNQNPFTNNSSGGTQVGNNGGGLFTTPTTSGSGLSSNAPTNNTPVNPFFTSTQQAKQVQQNQELLDLQQNSNDQSTHQSLITLPKLTEDDIAKYKAEKFIFGQIPTCPPPLELCR